MIFEYFRILTIPPNALFKGGTTVSGGQPERDGGLSRLHTISVFEKMSTGGVCF